MKMISTILQVSGATAIALGAFFISIPAGLIVGGVLAIMIGIALGR